jgi:hypothetical protein
MQRLEIRVFLCVSGGGADDDFPLSISGVTTPALGAPPLLNQLIFTHIFGWTRGVWNAHLQP